MPASSPPGGERAAGAPRRTETVEEGLRSALSHGKPGVQAVRRKTDRLQLEWGYTPLPHYKSHTFLKFAFPPCVSSLTSKCLAHHLSDGAQMENVTSSFSFTSNYSSGVERLPGLRANRPPLCPPPPEGVCLWVPTGKLKNQKDLHKC